MDKFTGICAGVGFIFILGCVTKFWGWLENLVDFYLEDYWFIWLLAQIVLYIAPIALIYFAYLKAEKAYQEKVNEEWRKQKEENENGIH